MPKIRGKFAPLFDELGNDSRFLLELNDFEKLMYLLVLCTVYWNNGTAPDDPRYYHLRYALRSRSGHIKHALDTLKAVYPKLICSNKKLSLLNYKGYENRVTPLEGLEGEGEGEIEGEGRKATIQPSNVTKSTKDKCLEILKCKIFKNVSESDKQKAFEKYPVDFLHDRLKSYAFRPKQIAIRSETFTKWIAEDFEKFKKETAKLKSAAADSEKSRAQLKKMQDEAAPPPPEFLEAIKKLKGRRYEEKKSKN